MTYPIKLTPIRVQKIFTKPTELKMITALAEEWGIDARKLCCLLLSKCIKNEYKKITESDNNE